MPYTVVGKNTMLTALGVTHVSAHTGDPGETGINEVTGGSYGRQSVTFTTASAGNLDSSNVPTIPIPEYNSKLSRVLERSNSRHFLRLHRYSR